MNSSEIANSSEATVAIVLQWVMRTLLPFCILFGLPANLLTIIVFCRDSCEVPPTARFYYTLMAALDIVPLIVNSLTDFLGLAVPALLGATWLPQGNLWMCRLCRYLWGVTETTSNFTLAVLCIERTYAVRNPLKAKTVITLKRAVLIVTVIAVVTCGYFTILLFGFEVIHLGATVDCVASPTAVGTAVFYCISFGMMFIPASVESVMNVYLIILLFRSLKTRMQLQKVPAHDTASTTKEISVTLTVICISLLHLIVYDPNSVAWIVFGMLQFYGDANQARYVYYIANIMVRFTAIIRWTNFTVYVSRMPRFRKNLAKLFLF